MTFDPFKTLIFDMIPPKLGQKDSSVRVSKLRICEARKPDETQQNTTKIGLQSIAARLSRFLIPVTSHMTMARVHVSLLYIDIYIYIIYKSCPVLPVCGCYSDSVGVQPGVVHGRLNALHLWSDWTAERGVVSADSQATAQTDAVDK